jgi:hypothetical protein
MATSWTDVHQPHRPILRQPTRSLSSHLLRTLLNTDTSLDLSPSIIINNNQIFKMDPEVALSMVLKEHTDPPVSKANKARCTF